MIRAAAVPSVMVVLLICGGCTAESSSQASTKPVAVRTVTLMEQQVRRTSTQPATIHAYFKAEIQAKVSGYVGQLLVDIGDVVAKGDVLAVLDIPELIKQREIIEAQIRLSRAQERQAEAGLQLAEANVESARAKLAQVESEAVSAEAELTAAEAEFERTKDLVDRQSLESRMLDEVRKKRDSALATRDASRSAIQSARAAVTVALAEQSSAQASLSAAQAETKISEAQLGELDVMLAYTELRSPFDGVVTERWIDIGDLVHEADQKGEPLLAVSQVNRVRVQIPVPEIDAAHVSRGDEITLSFPSFAAEETLTTTVTRRSGSLDPSTRTMLVEAEIDNADGKLLPGMFGRATIALSTGIAANMLPARAVRFDEQGNAFVYLVEDDSARRVAVTTGLDDGRSIEIVAGLAAGQDVIDAHLNRFADGEKVRRLN